MWYDALTCSLWRPWGLFPFLRLRGVVCAEAQIDSSTNSRDARLAPAMPPGENSLEQLLLIAAANGEDAEVKNTPLQSALDYTQTSTIKLLLSRGADVNCKDVEGFTPLLNAVRCSDQGTAEMLIAHGADVNCGNNCGFTPLHSAVKRNCTSTAEMLLAHGADINSKTNSME
eukprot:m.251501 g.251501  ORF g.251501 m.251501 type:complete len:172 (-) comp10975_c0_seq15:543-1058(-)